MNIKPIAIGIILSCSLFAFLGFIFSAPQPIDASFIGPLKSASFAPFRDGQSPLTETFPTPAEIESDLILLKGTISGIRTYTSSHGMELVPELAEKYGFHLTHSAWLGREEDKNNIEIETLIKAANQHPNAVNRVIVGNEVLLRQDLSSKQLIAHLDYVKAHITQPVSYADVWAFWLKYPEVAEHVDFITIHILPYWEDEPVSVDEAHQHLINTITLIKQRFPNKPILVGETGWPTAGRSRGPATANIINAANYLRKIPALAEQYQFDYNIVEAFDQTWKARSEGTVGARWGIFDAQRQPKFNFSGEVLPHPNNTIYLCISLFLGALLSLFFYKKTDDSKICIITGIFSQLIAVSLVYSVNTAITLAISPASFTWLQQYWLFFAAAKGWIAESSIKMWYELLLLHWVSIQAQLWAGILIIYSFSFFVFSILWLKNRSTRLTAWVNAAFFVYILSALFFSYMFAHAGRYMDIPTAYFLLPLSIYAYSLYVKRTSPENALLLSISSPFNFLNRYAKWLMPIAAIYCLWGEANAMLSGQDFTVMHPTLADQIPLIGYSLLANHELLLWAITCSLLGCVFSCKKDKTHA